MSNAKKTDEGAALAGTTLNISARVELGRQSQHFSKGAIVPFPKGYSGAHILTRLGGDARKRCERLESAGFQVTTFEYRSAEGEIIQSVIRFDHKSESKRVRPVRYCGPVDQGLPLFEMSAVDGQRPLYGLDRLAKRPDAPVLIVEGERTAEAGTVIFQDYVVITWMGGTGGVRRAELDALAGRTIVIWPDNDDAGRRAGRLMAALALQAGAASVGFVDVPPEFGNKWDLANDVPSELFDEYPLRGLLETARPLSSADLANLLTDARDRAEGRRLLGHRPGHSEVDKEVVADVLEELDPSMSRLEWIRIARCLYLAFAEDGLTIFDSWSKGSEEKYRAGEPARLWTEYGAAEDSFRAQSLAWLMRKVRDLPREEGKNFEIDKAAYVRAAIEEVNECHAVVTRGSKTVVIWEQFDPRFERFELSFLKKSDFTEKMVWKIPLPSEAGDKPEKKRSMPLGKLWFESGLRQQFNGIYFLPGRKVGPDELNTWTGFTVTPGDDPNGWSRLKGHLLNNVARGDQASYDYILNWLAFGVQRLDSPTGTALVLQGPKGAGKSILIVLYGALFGTHTWVTAISEDIVGKFNAHLETTLLLGVEEAFAPQNRAADGTLKDLITSKTLRVEDKFFSAWPAPSHLRIIMTSNNDQVVRADGSDRRYAVFEVTNPHQNDPDARRRYFGEMVEQMETGGYETMLGELLARDISGWNPETIPETEALRRQKYLNLSNDPVAAWYHSRLEDGIDILSGEAGTNTYEWSERHTVWVPISSVLDDYAAFAKRHGHRGDDQRLKNKLGRFMPPAFAGRAKKLGDIHSKRMTKCYPFPPIGEARELFTRATGFGFDDPSP